LLLLDHSPTHKLVYCRLGKGGADPIEELLYQGRAQQANLIVLGAHGASQFAAITRAGTVYKILAFAYCPVITLSPIVLAECGASEDRPFLSEVNYLAGVT
jgi:hypothetical protein